MSANQSYVYILSEPGLWTVGFYDPQGRWHSESDHNNTQAAGHRVHYLNGGVTYTALDSDRASAHTYG